MFERAPAIPPRDSGAYFGLTMVVPEAVELILGWLANGWTHEMILESYPQLAREDILAALAFAAEMMRDEEYVAMHKATA